MLILFNVNTLPTTTNGFSCTATSICVAYTQVVRQ